jgi:hypothetical protein
VFDEGFTGLFVRIHFVGAFPLFENRWLMFIDDGLGNEPFVFRIYSEGSKRLVPLVNV